MEEFAGLAAIAKARRENTRTLLAGTHLEWGKWAQEKNAASIIKSAGQLGSAVKKWAKTSKQVAEASNTDPHQVIDAGHKLISICGGVHDFSELKDAVTGDAMHAAIGEMAPFLGILTSAYGCVKSWKEVFESGYGLYKNNEAKLDVLPGDPRAAADAIITLLERKLANDSVTAARNTAALASKIGGLFADFGTGTTAAIGAVNAAASLAQQLAMLGLDYSDKKAGNDLLKQDKIDLNVFKACPILGCYIIVCSDTSNVLNFFVADIGLPNWMDRVEDMKKNSLDRLIKDANKFIVASRLHLEGAPTNKGIEVQKTFSQKVKEAFNSLMKTKTPAVRT